MKRKKTAQLPSAVAETTNVSYAVSHMKRPPPPKTFTAVVERCPDTGPYIGYIPGFIGAHSQGATLDELNCNLQEVIEMLLEDGEPQLEAEFVGIQTIAVRRHGRPSRS